MPIVHRLRTASPLSLIVPLAGLMLLAGAAVAQTAAPTPVLTKGVQVRMELQTGRVRAMSGERRGEPIGTLTGRPITSPQEFLAQRAGAFGVRNPNAELSLAKQTVDNIGWTTTEYRQMHVGVPVFSGVLKVHQDAQGRVMAANGNFHAIPDKLNVVPTIDAAEAERAARFAVHEAAHGAVVRSDLVVVDPGWYGDPARGTRLAWHIELADANVPVHAAMFLDAHTGEVLDVWSMIHNIKDRQIYDGMGGSSLPGSNARNEGAPATGDFDIDAAYDYYGDTYDYYFRAFGRDSIDDAGLPMIATVHSTAPTCPNAYWNGIQMVFCDDTVTDDVVAHELTHGVTQYTAGLIYQNQSGQLNESFSDVFGELVDLFNGDAAFAGAPGGTPWPGHSTGPGLDTPNNARGACSPAGGYPDGVRWLIGEDAFAFGGAIRDMWIPSCDGDPDDANHPNQVCFTTDSGGVHSGSGVPNHAFALLTDGATYNSIVVTGIGPIKAGAVWYRALTTYLTPASDFEDAYWAFNQAAADLVGTTPNDPRTGAPSASAFTPADATQVDNALRAVEMDTPGLCGQTIDVLDWEFTPNLSSGTLLFAEDFESGAPGWSVGHSVPGGTGYDWALASGGLPYAHPGTAYFIANSPFGGGDETGTHWLTSPIVAMPGLLTFPILAFDHYVDTEWLWDGGQVQINVNGGGWTDVPGDAFLTSGYNDVLFTLETNSNPNAGEAAFTGSGGRWGRSVIDLRGFAGGGDDVQLRFEFSKDGCCGQSGWYVDDVRILEMGTPPDCNGNALPDFAENPANDPAILWSRPPSLGTSYSSDEKLPQILATRIHLPLGGTVEKVRVWGRYDNNNPPPANFTVEIFTPNTASFFEPGPTVYSESGVANTRTFTGQTTIFGSDVYEVELTLAAPVALGPGAYWFEVRDNTTGFADSFNWFTASFNAGLSSFAYTFDAPPNFGWNYSRQTQLAMELVSDAVAAPLCVGDLDGNCRTDVLDFSVFAAHFAMPVAPGTGGDLDGNGFVNVLDFALFAADFGCGAAP